VNRPDPSRPSVDESIAATAAAWLAQRDDGLTAAEAERFTRWRAADPRHEAAALRLEGAWSALQPLRDFRPAAQRHPDPDLLASPARGRLLGSPAYATALALAAALIVAVGWWALVSPSAAPLRYTTTAGGYERVILADGSVLELNGDTSAAVTYTPAARRVLLERGEAHFIVAKNPARPFWVEADGIAVRAVGTAFNVRLGPREVEVLVTEGKVTVSDAPPLLPKISRAQETSSTWSPRTSPVDTFLVAYERARIARPELLTAIAAAGPPTIEQLSPTVVGEILAWQGPRLVFVDTSLSEIVAQFNRRNAVQLILADPSLATLRVGGSFRAENVEAFVRLLESGGDVVVDRPDSTHLVLHRVK